MCGPIPPFLPQGSPEVKTTQDIREQDLEAINELENEKFDDINLKEIETLLSSKMYQDSQTTPGKAIQVEKNSNANKKLKPNVKLASTQAKTLESKGLEIKENKGSTKKILDAIIHRIMSDHHREALAQGRKKSTPRVVETKKADNEKNKTIHSLDNLAVQKATEKTQNSSPRYTKIAKKAQSQRDSIVFSRLEVIAHNILRVLRHRDKSGPGSKLRYKINRDDLLKIRDFIRTTRDPNIERKIKIHSAKEALTAIKNLMKLIKRNKLSNDKIGNAFQAAKEIDHRAFSKSKVPTDENNEPENKKRQGKTKKVLATNNGTKLEHDKKYYLEKLKMMRIELLKDKLLRVLKMQDDDKLNVDLKRLKSKLEKQEKREKRNQEEPMKQEHKKQAGKKKENKKISHKFSKEFRKIIQMKITKFKTIMKKQENAVKRGTKRFLLARGPNSFRKNLISLENLDANNMTDEDLRKLHDKINEWIEVEERLERGTQNGEAKDEISSGINQASDLLSSLELVDVNGKKVYENTESEGKKNRNLEITIDIDKHGKSNSNPSISIKKDNGNEVEILQNESHHDSKMYTSNGFSPGKIANEATVNTDATNNINQASKTYDSNGGNPVVTRNSNNEGNVYPSTSNPIATYNLNIAGSNPGVPNPSESQYLKEMAKAYMDGKAISENQNFGERMKKLEENFENNINYLENNNNNNLNNKENLENTNTNKLNNYNKNLPSTNQNEFKTKNDGDFESTNIQEGTTSVGKENTLENNKAYNKNLKSDQIINNKVKSQQTSNSVNINEKGSAVTNHTAPDDTKITQTAENSAISASKDINRNGASGGDISSYTVNGNTEKTNGNNFNDIPNKKGTNTNQVAKNGGQDSNADQVANQITSTGEFKNEDQIASAGQVANGDQVTNIEQAANGARVTDQAHITHGGQVPSSDQIASAVQESTAGKATDGDQVKDVEQVANGGQAPSSNKIANTGKVANGGELPSGDHGANAGEVTNTGKAINEGILPNGHVITIVADVTNKQTRLVNNENSDVQQNINRAANQLVNTMNQDNPSSVTAGRQDSVSDQPDKLKDIHPAKKLKVTNPPDDDDQEYDKSEKEQEQEVDEASMAEQETLSKNKTPFLQSGQTNKFMPQPNTQHNNVAPANLQVHPHSFSNDNQNMKQNINIKTGSRPMVFHRVNSPTIDGPTILKTGAKTMLGAVQNIPNIQRLRSPNSNQMNEKNVHGYQSYGSNKNTGTHQRNSGVAGKLPDKLEQHSVHKFSDRMNSGRPLQEVGPPLKQTPTESKNENSDETENEVHGFILNGKEIQDDRVGENKMDKTDQAEFSPPNESKIKQSDTTSEHVNPGDGNPGENISYEDRKPTNVVTSNAPLNKKLHGKALLDDFLDEERSKETTSSHSISQSTTTDKHNVHKVKSRHNAPSILNGKVMKDEELREDESEVDESSEEDMDNTESTDNLDEEVIRAEHSSKITEDVPQASNTDPRNSQAPSSATDNAEITVNVNEEATKTSKPHNSEGLPAEAYDTQSTDDDSDVPQYSARLVGEENDEEMESYSNPAMKNARNWHKHHSMENARLSQEHHRMQNAKNWHKHQSTENAKNWHKHQSTENARNWHKHESTENARNSHKHHSMEKAKHRLYQFQTNHKPIQQKEVKHRNHRFPVHLIMKNNKHVQNMYNIQSANETFTNQTTVDHSQQNTKPKPIVNLKKVPDTDALIRGAMRSIPSRIIHIVKTQPKLTPVTTKAGPKVVTISNSSALNEGLSFVMPKLKKVEMAVNPMGRKETTNLQDAKFIEKTVHSGDQKSSTGGGGGGLETSSISIPGSQVAAQSLVGENKMANLNSNPMTSSNEMASPNDVDRMTSSTDPTDLTEYEHRIDIAERTGAGDIVPVGVGANNPNVRPVSENSPQTTPTGGQGTVPEHVLLSSNSAKGEDLVKPLGNDPDGKLAAIQDISALTKAQREQETNQETDKTSDPAFLEGMSNRVSVSGTPLDAMGIANTPSIPLHDVDQPGSTIMIPGEKLKRDEKGAWSKRKDTNAQFTVDNKVVALGTGSDNPKFSTSSKNGQVNSIATVQPADKPRVGGQAGEHEAKLTSPQHNPDITTTLGPRIAQLVKEIITESLGNGQVSSSTRTQNKATKGVFDVPGKDNELLLKSEKLETKPYHAASGRKESEASSQVNPQSHSPADTSKASVFLPNVPSNSEGDQVFLNEQQHPADIAGTMNALSESNLSKEEKIKLIKEYEKSQKTSHALTGVKPNKAEPPPSSAEVEESKIQELLRNGKFNEHDLKSDFAGKEAAMQDMMLLEKQRDIDDKLSQAHLIASQPSKPKGTGNELPAGSQRENAMSLPGNLSPEITLPGNISPGASLPETLPAGMSPLGNGLSTSAGLSGNRIPGVGSQGEISGVQTQIPGNRPFSKMDVSMMAKETQMAKLLEQAQRGMPQGLRRQNNVAYGSRKV